MRVYTRLSIHNSSDRGACVVCVNRYFGAEPADGLGVAAPAANASGFAFAAPTMTGGFAF